MDLQEYPKYFMIWFILSQHKGDAIKYFIIWTTTQAAGPIYYRVVKASSAFWSCKDGS